MMEAASTSETSVNFYQTTQRNKSNDSRLHGSFVAYKYMVANKTEEKRKIKG
jgi:hypothetical protein